jgi:hypothetical protein
MSEETAQVNFNGLVTGLATSVVAVLGQIETILETGQMPGEGDEKLSADEQAKRVADGLLGARQLIDTLAVLEEKTQGNLDDDERELLQTAISELRLRYVSLANRTGRPEATEGQAG